VGLRGGTLAGGQHPVRLEELAAHQLVGGSLRRLLNEELMDRAVSSHHPDADELGGSG
jgi:hypothetical protein